MTENVQTNEIARLMDEGIDVDDLYETLAESAGLGADQIDKPSAGKAFFARIWAQQKAAVCGNKLVQVYIRDPNASDATTIATQVLGILVVIPGVNMAVIACLAVRIGLRSLCAAPAQ